MMAQITQTLHSTLYVQFFHIQVITRIFIYQNELYSENLKTILVFRKISPHFQMLYSQDM